MPVQMILDLALLALVTLAGAQDLLSRRIPNRLLLVAWAVALPLQAGLGGAGLLDGLIGAGVGLLLFLPLYLLRGMAAGDVKLLATVGAFAGPAATFQIAVLAWCVGGVMALAIIVGRGHVRAALRNLRDLLRPIWLRLAGLPALPATLSRPGVGDMPYGLAIALATVAVVWARHA
ncbi:A24 family peptidase [Massilia terrae]|uniref:A24 family peptidase n=1 Tax=Massilia terrae TaxID=1811224 RepID=A0ABT2CY49_9BURK|nr:A24 family peptidase [Massilia terrae]MCS0658905.1 A24 family peptidase [Massilia terrae]